MGHTGCGDAAGGRRGERQSRVVGCAGRMRGAGGVGAGSSVGQGTWCPAIAERLLLFRVCSMATQGGWMLLRKHLQIHREGCGLVEHCT